MMAFLVLHINNVNVDFSQNHFASQTWWICFHFWHGPTIGVLHYKSVLITDVSRSQSLNTVYMVNFGSTKPWTIYPMHFVDTGSLSYRDHSDHSMISLASIRFFFHIYLRQPMTKWQFYGQVSTADRRKEGRKEMNRRRSMSTTAETRRQDRGQTNFEWHLTFPLCG